MQSTEAGEHLTDVRLNKFLTKVIPTKNDYVPKPCLPEGNHSPQVRRGGKAKVSVPAERKAAGNRFQSMRMIA